MDTIRPDFIVRAHRFDEAVVDHDERTYVRTAEGWWGSITEDGRVVEILSTDTVRKLESKWRRWRLTETAASLAGGEA